MLWISSRISGWRVTDSITLPKMKPTPIPAPIDPRPAPIPSAIALSPSSVTPLLLAAAMRVDMEVLLSVTVGGGCLAEVDGRERREDERLQRRDQAHLEEEEDERERQRQEAERREAEQDG